MLDADAADIVDAFARVCALRAEDTALLQGICARQQQQQQRQQQQADRNSVNRHCDADGCHLDNKYDDDDDEYDEHRDGDGDADGGGGPQYRALMCDEVRGREEWRRRREQALVARLADWETAMAAWSDSDGGDNDDTTCHAKARTCKVSGSRGAAARRQWRGQPQSQPVVLSAARAAYGLSPSFLLVEEDGTAVHVHVHGGEEGGAADSGGPLAMTAPTAAPSARVLLSSQSPQQQHYGPPLLAAVYDSLFKAAPVHSDASQPSGGGLLGGEELLRRRFPLTDAVSPPSTPSSGSASKQQQQPPSSSSSVPPAATLVDVKAGTRDGLLHWRGQWRLVLLLWLHVAVLQCRSRTEAAAALEADSGGDDVCRWTSLPSRVARESLSAGHAAIDALVAAVVGS